MSVTLSASLDEVAYSYMLVLRSTFPIYTHPYLPFRTVKIYPHELVLLGSHFRL